MFSSSGPIQSQIRSIDQIQPVLERAKVTQSRQKGLLIALGILGLAATAGCIAGSVILFPKALKEIDSAGYGLAAAGLTTFSLAFLVGSVAMFVWSGFVDHKKERIKELREDRTLDERVKAQVLLQLHENFSPSVIYWNPLQNILRGGLFSTQEIGQLNLDGYLARLKASDDNETKALLFREAAGSNILKEYNPGLRGKILNELGPSITQVAYPIDLEVLETLPNLQQLTLDLAGKPDLIAINIPRSVTQLTIVHPPANLHELLIRCPQVGSVTLRIPVESNKEGVKGLIENVKNLNISEILFIISAPCNYFSELSRDYSKDSGVAFVPAQLGGGLIKICKRLQLS